MQKCEERARESDDGSIVDGRWQPTDRVAQVYEASSTSISL